MIIKTWVEIIGPNVMGFEYYEQWHAYIEEEPWIKSWSITEEAAIAEVKTKYLASKKGRTVEWDGISL